MELGGWEGREALRKDGGGDANYNQNIYSMNFQFTKKD